MFPLSADKLSFLKIADYWSRELPASQNELLARLEAAWWLGDIVGSSAITRLQLLKNMYRSRHEPDMQSIVFVTRTDAGPPTDTPLADGGVIVDIRPRITVPGETDDWTDNSCSDSFAELAQLPSRQYFPHLSYSICFIELTPEEFFRWITKFGFYEPKFWKRTTEIDLTQATTPQGSATSNDSHIASAANFGGRGAKKRAVQMALKALFPNGKIPPGMTSQHRNDLICEMLKKSEGNRSLPDKRTIERVIKDLTED